METPETKGTLFQCIIEGIPLTTANSDLQQGANSWLVGLPDSAEKHLFLAGDTAGGAPTSLHTTVNYEGGILPSCPFFKQKNRGNRMSHPPSYEADQKEVGDTNQPQTKGRTAILIIVGLLLCLAALTYFAMESPMHPRAIEIA
jgi:hypothetical protein